MVGICAFDNEGGGQRVCCLAPVEVVSKEANCLITLYSQSVHPLTPPPPLHLGNPLPPCLAEVSLFMAVEGEKRGGLPLFFWRKEKRKETRQHEYRQVLKSEGCDASV